MVNTPPTPFAPKRSRSAAPSSELRREEQRRGQHAHAGIAAVCCAVQVRDNHVVSAALRSRNTITLAGGGFKHGQHLHFDPKNPPPLCNLYVNMLQRLGIEADKFGTGTGTLTGLEFSRA